ncbi:MAG: lipoyl(octanoyl) transferase LipB [Alcanivoracaceae bacterium]|jgi:lipoyl(octanoyl) transferase|nr:lipoyl(octanoyl) transferase LipB [Alcanivoracaceae bacterium]
MPNLLIRHFPRVDYPPCWQAMKNFTDQRDEHTPDELWLLEHPDVFTLGQAGKPEHVLNPGPIPLVQTDRGGQVTWHGPGQTVGYLLFDIARMGIGARELVSRIEQAIVDYLATLDIEAAPRKDAPGVYVGTAKIASLGLRIRHGRSYHGLSLNRDVDMAVFQRINPCGHIGQPMTSLALLGADPGRTAVEAGLQQTLCQHFAFDNVTAAGLPDWYTGALSESPQESPSP